MTPSNEKQTNLGDDRVKPRACPFCSVRNTDEAEELIFTTRDGQKFIKCSNCGAKGPHVQLSPNRTSIDTEFNEAAEAWNRRFEDVRLEAYKAALIECADDLEAELRDRWCNEPDGSCHPALLPKYDRDMAVVRKARTLIKQGDPVDDQT